MAKQTFVADAILTAAQMNALQGNDFNQTVSTKTASYTLVAADAGTKVVMNAGATNTTITVNTSLFAANDTLTILNISTSGTCTITAGTATVATAGSLALGLNQGGTLYFTSAGVSVFQADGITATASGLVRVGGGTLSSGSVTFSSVFSATYNAYLVSISNLEISSATRLEMRLGASGTPNTVSYQSHVISTSGASVVAELLPATSSYQANELTTTAGQGSTITIVNPFLAKPSKFFNQSLYMGAPIVQWNSLGTHNVSTSFNDLVIFIGAGSFTTGTVGIYGLSLS